MELVLDEEEVRKSRTQSLAYTSVLALLMYLAFYLINIHFPFEKEVLEKRYEVVGVFEFEATVGSGGAGNGTPGPSDYGDLKNGSGNVNNMLPSIKDPDPNATSSPKSAAAAPARTPKSEGRTLTQNSPSVIKTTERIRKPKPDNSDLAEASTTGNGSARDGGTPGRAGSNHGNGDGVGNAGSPDGETLDPRGLFGGGGGGGGNGFDGLGGRGVIRADRPSIQFSSDGRVKFKVVIAPDGRVVAYEPVQGLTPGLRDACRQATAHVLRYWKFEPVDRTAGNQVCYHTINFRLN